MSEDLRNSILLWVGGIAIFGVLWLSLRFDLLRGLPEGFGQAALAFVILVQLVQLCRFLWRRRTERESADSR
ncbi:hypothetical protein [Sphingomonas sp.]|uniref:hypothetical protein n=1 Tax=Sphingomonas sp. TaxID=28214 RepID=UPI001B0F0569|nr:hypothetical protein [Sphingomonas sp.]MBO9712805.1 hypothetical protein [Sphingomonas sp.]